MDGIQRLRGLGRKICNKNKIINMLYIAVAAVLKLFIYVKTRENLTKKNKSFRRMSPKTVLCVC